MGRYSRMWRAPPRRRGADLAAHVMPWNKGPVFLLGMMLGSQALLLTAAGDASPRAARRWRAAADGITLLFATYTVVQGGGSPDHRGFGFSSRQLGELLFFLPVAKS